MSNYAIIPEQIGNGFIGKVYLIQCLEPPNNKLIIKVFNANDIDYYNKEKEILLRFTNTDYIIKLKTYEIILDNSPVLEYNSRYLLFDYLEHGNLCQYLHYIKSFDQISEEYVKYFCDKLLKALKIIHGNNICHNKLDISNILLDNEFNPVIIHFTEAFEVTNNNYYRKDFVGLANILAMLMTQGYFLHCKYNKSEKYFEITDSAKKKCKDSTFWKRVSQAMHISPTFIKFFNALIKTKNINIDDLYNLEWLVDLKNNNYLNEIENKTKIYFQKRYQNLFKLKQEDSFAKVDFNSILNEPINNNNSLFSNDFNKSESNNDENHQNLEIKKIENEPRGIVFDYIEIITNNNNLNHQNSNIPYNFMIQYQNIIENSLINIKIDYSTKYLSFTINFEENKNDEKNEEDKANKNKEFDEYNGNDEEKNDYIDDNFETDQVNTLDKDGYPHDSEQVNQDVVKSVPNQELYNQEIQSPKVGNSYQVSVEVKGPNENEPQENNENIQSPNPGDTDAKQSYMANKEMTSPKQEEAVDDYLNISDDEDNTENLIINVEFLEYNKKNNIGDIYNDTYYLMFHRIQGEICDYYYYLKQLKEKAKQLLKQVINNE